jgi:uncharacterized protein YggE
LNYFLGKFFTQGEIMRMRCGFVFGVSLLVAPTLFSQNIDVNRQNRNVEVVVTESISAEPEIANVRLACLTYGQTHDAAYQTNLQRADQILKALFAAGVSKDEITSSNLELEDMASRDSEPAKLDKARQFQALQIWTVRLASSDAQKIIDIAAQAGANGIESVSWEVKDTEALEHKARVAAIEKAKAAAAEIASGLGAKLGEPIYASNQLSGFMALLSQSRQTMASAMSVAESSEPRFSLQLFPEKVQRAVTIRVVFGLD